MSSISSGTNNEIIMYFTCLKFLSFDVCNFPPYEYILETTSTVDTEEKIYLISGKNVVEMSRIIDNC